MHFTHVSIGLIQGAACLSYVLGKSRLRLEQFSTLAIGSVPKGSMSLAANLVMC